MTIEEYFGDWSKVVDLDEVKSIVNKLPSNTCPNKKDIFKAFHHCHLKDLRVIVIGQDPYPDFYKGNPRATGIAFANTSDTPEEDYSPSLAVLRESVIDYTIPHRRVIFDPSLEKWEEQGVLMLNSALSCEKGKIGSHALLWWPFMKSLITNLSEHTTGIVYVLMGSQAQSLEPFIKKEFNRIIRIRHPSYYARTNTKMSSEIWQEINQILIGQNGTGIEWYQEY